MAPVCIKPSQPGFGPSENRPIALRAGRLPLWWLAPPPCPVGSVSLDPQSPTAPCESSSLATRWEACHWIRGSRGPPMNPVPLPPPQFGGAAKGKRLNGQARRLTSPHLEVLCRTSTGALWVLSHGDMSLQESIERFILSPGWGKVRRSRIRGSRAAANHQNAYYVI